MEVEAVTRSGETKTLTLDCVDPEETEVETGWPDMAPYTKHKVKAWFSNDAGETDKAEVEGYNAEAKPSKPNLSEDQPEEHPREVSVEFDSMTDEDLNGKFKDYKVCTSRFVVQLIRVLIGSVQQKNYRFLVSAFVSKSAQIIIVTSFF